MEHHVNELTYKLLRSLNSEYQIVDLQAVIGVISAAEKLTIEEEYYLEVTRLPQFLLLMRKNTTDKALSRRIKTLVKNWCKKKNHKKRLASPVLEEACPAKKKPNINFSHDVSMRCEMESLPETGSEIAEVEEEVPCTCKLVEGKVMEGNPSWEFEEDRNCLGKDYFSKQQSSSSVNSENTIYRLHSLCLPNINGNYGYGTPMTKEETVDGFYSSVVPKMLAEDVFQSDRVREGNLEKRFFGWHESYEVPSNNGGPLKIMPYVNTDFFLDD